ncbi:MAG: MBL fold metallo-hydrolase [Planctomycetota bacterium]|jgi:glyoxylase-like metal-dependent hydrolase (beta-lactamase superfamily II)
MNCTLDVVSIGTLSRNVFWNEKATVRPAHATTTLIREGTQTILVDPSLPAELLAHRLDERAGLKPAQIDLVFLTNFRPVHRRSLELFDRATWMLAEEERTAVINHLKSALQDLGGSGPDQPAPPAEIQQELTLVERTVVPPDRLTPTVHLFPAPGPSIGAAGLLLEALKTVVIAGDAVLTRDHFEHGRVFDRSADPGKARESFADILEVAEIIIPGHDNLIVVA